MKVIDLEKVFPLFKSRKLVFQSRMSASQIQGEISRYEHWYHTFEFENGVQTTAPQDSPEVLRSLEKIGLPRKASGLRVLDVGCSDGFYSFAMEKRGAEVVSVDFADVSKLGFGIMKNVLESKITPLVDVIYNLTPEKYGNFDIILFMGVLYHLRHPLLGLDRARALLKTSGKLFIETQMMYEHIDDGGIPLLRFLPRNELNDDYTNFFIPNRKAVEALLVATEFRVTGFQEAHPTRGCFSAVAVDDQISAQYRVQEWRGPNSEDVLT